MNLVRVLIAVLVSQSAAFVVPATASMKRVARCSEPAMPIWDFGTANFERPTPYQHNKGIFGFSFKNDRTDYGRSTDYEFEGSADIGGLALSLALPAIGVAFCAAIISS
uniref:Uncharacterized protein n=1 Tax=Haptolina brevifila TaxID=156173 RepID=A0A7S2JM41_9EUKA